MLYLVLTLTFILFISGAVVISTMPMVILEHIYGDTKRLRLWFWSLFIGIPVVGTLIVLSPLINTDEQYRFDDVKCVQPLNVDKNSDEYVVGTKDTHRGNYYMLLDSVNGEHYKIIDLPKNITTIKKVETDSLYFKTFKTTLNVFWLNTKMEFLTNSKNEYELYVPENTVFRDTELNVD